MIQKGHDVLLDHLNVYRQFDGGSCEIGVASPTLKALVYVLRAVFYTNPPAMNKQFWYAFKTNHWATCIHTKADV